MQKRTLVVASVIGVALISVISCPFLIFSSAARHAIYTALGRTGSATVEYENATLVVVQMPTEPPVIQGVPGTTNQAIGVLIPQSNGYELKSLATDASLVLEQNEPLAVSQDWAYLQVGNQQVRLSDWTLVESRERGWEPLEEDVDTTMDGVPSQEKRVYFSVRKSLEGYPLLRGDWRIDTFVPRGPNTILYYGLGEVQQAGWGPDQQTIYIANDGRIRTVSLNQGAVR